jgi:hypothetical protein
MIRVMMMEAIRPFETLVLTRATWRHIQEDGILQEEHVSERDNVFWK